MKIEEQPVRQRVDGAGLRHYLQRLAKLYPERSQLTIVCVGTDCSTGDSLGPWLGTMLRYQGWENVVGTLSEPCDAERYPSVIETLDKASIVIAVDACLGKQDSVGDFLVAAEPLYPARVTGKNLQPVGHYSIAGVVGLHTIKPYWSLQRAPLSMVIAMARQAADAFEAAWPGRKRGHAQTSLIQYLLGKDDRK